MIRAKIFPVLLLALFLFAETAGAQQTLEGKWNGYIDLNGTHLTLIIEFDSTDSVLTGTIDIPQQGGYNIPLHNISANIPDSIEFEMMAGLSMARFRGSFEADSTITGTFHQSGQQFPFRLTKVSQPTVTKNHVLESCNQEELIIENNSISIGGTLIQPKNEASKTLAIIISGSGAQNRDGVLPITDFAPYSVLADSLCGNGIASFRFDDRGIGQSNGSFSNATLNDLTSDVGSIINYFSERHSQTFSEIILVGHSQGGVVAARAAVHHPNVDKLILMASTGVPLKEVLRFQVRQAYEQAGIDSFLIEKEIAAREDIMQAVTQGGNLELATKEYRRIFEKVQISAGMDSAQAKTVSENQANQLVSVFQSPQVKSLLYYDPIRDLEELNIPVLTLFGGKDTQVTVEMNRNPIISALDSAGVSYQTETFEHANHLFQKANSGSVQEYGMLDSRFVEDFIPTISKWIKKSRY